MKMEELLRILLFLLSMALIVSLYIFFSRKSTLADLRALSESHTAQLITLSEISSDLNDYREFNNLSVVENSAAENDNIQSSREILKLQNESDEKEETPPDLEDIHNRLRATALEHAQARQDLAPQLRSLFHIVGISRKSSLILISIYVLFVLSYGFHSRR
ncbi:MAG: hypothetical protein PF637_00450 [Spirochaetes bacterium]|jgi:hypothetical protein|nr:hypothetical protein [Spirochaetota bacterium]